MLAQQLNWKPGIARSNSCLGGNYFILADYPNAYQYFTQALKINEGLNNKEGMANNLHNIGLVFFSQKNYEKALAYYNRALRVSQEIGKTDFASYSYTAIGKLFADQKDLSHSLEYHYKALALDNQVHNKKRIASDQLNIASVYIDQAEYAKALDILFQALPIKKELHELTGVCQAYQLIGKTYFTQSNGDKTLYLKAKAYLDSSIQIGKQTGSLDYLQHSYEYVAKTEEALGTWQQAISDYKEYAAIKDSVFSISRQAEIFNLEKKAELDEKQREEERAEEAHQRIRYIQMAGISLFIIVLIGGVLLLSRRRIKRAYVELLSTLSLIILFEFVQLLLHGPVEKITHHDLLLTFLYVLGIAALIIPVHHRIEHWMHHRISLQTSPKKHEVAEGVEL